MKSFRILPLIFAISFLVSCSQDPTTTPSDPDPVASIEFTGLCIPPLTVDTSEVTMVMKLNDVPYTPNANWACVIPNIFLGINQIWINGSIPFAKKVVTLMMPTDIAPGTYTLQYNSPYDARYTPSDGNYFTVDFGTLTITSHDQVSRHIEGGFEFTATNLDSPVLPTVTFTMGCFQANY